MSAASEPDHGHQSRSATNDRPASVSNSRWPTWPDYLRALTLQDYNTRIVVIGTTLLGAAAGVIGTFAYLRKRAMVGDALSHSTLPGIAVAFLITESKSLGALLLGAAVSGALGVFCVIGLGRFRRIKVDAAIGIVLSVFFGMGMVLMTIIQKMQTGNQAGLDRFIYGKSAGMILSDALLIGAAAVGVALGSVLFFKEFRLVCFDADFGASLGRSPLVIDALMMTLVVVTTVVGLQAVGLILVVALLIIPAASARFWTDNLRRMTVLAALFGAVSCWIGATFSALVSNVPTGAVIVVCAGFVFFLSMLFAPLRGLAAELFRQATLRRRIAYQNLMRAMAEREEQDGTGAASTFNELLLKRSWTASTLKSLLRRGQRLQEVAKLSFDRYALTRPGRLKADRVLRNHRLWEAYLIRHADIAPSHVDRDADMIEHILSPELVRELESTLSAGGEIPPSPHGEVVRQP
ncbi:MAG: metal ABC transporter permease [Phycisphaerae bacterium]|nr:metal ABC transporter permease [Phycisphaerae bacterium]